MSVDAHDTALPERSLARTMVRAAMRASDVDHAGATDVDLGRFVGLRQADALWLSARAVAGDAGATSSSATGVLGTALTAVAQSNLRGRKKDPKALKIAPKPTLNAFGNYNVKRSLFAMQ